VLAIDPRRLDVRVEVADTPRGPMPHVHGAIPRDAAREMALEDVPAHDERVRGTRIAFAAFPGMTLLDLVGPLDALSRIASMGEDPDAVCEVVALAEDAERRVHAACGLEVRAARLRPDLSSYDLVVVPGGHGTRALERDARAVAWLGSYPDNRLLASVCTGALLLGAAGRLRGRRATTHHTAHAELARFGATLEAGARVVDDGPIVTAAGVTAGLDLGLHLVRRIAGDAAAARIARQMEMP